MKKFIICLLLICITVLGCFALTACDGNDSSSANNEPRVEFVRNKYIYYSYALTPYSTNLYTLRLWYPNQWFIDGYSDVNIGYKLAIDDELTYPVKFAEYLYRTDVDNNRYSIKPDSWIYLDIEFKSAPSIVYFEVNIQKAIYDDNLNWVDTQTIVLFQSQINLTGTYKTA